jgi:TonB family protein
MRKITSPVVISLLLFALVFDARLLASTRERSLAAQAPATGQPQAAWETYTFNGEEFSVALPEMPAFDHSSRTVRGSRTKYEAVRVYAAYGNGIVYSIRAYDNPRSNEDLDHFAKSHMESVAYTNTPFELGAGQELRLGGFPGRRYVLKRDITPAGIPASSLYVYLTRKHAYALRVVGAGDDHPEAQRFLASFNLTQHPAGRQVVDEWQLPRPSVVLDYAAPNPAVDNNAGQPVYKISETTRKADIVSRPAPPYTEEARRNQTTGTVRLRFVATADGKIKNIVVHRFLPDGLTENAILAAAHLKFIPAVKDGRPVSQYVTIEYNFNIY